MGKAAKILGAALVALTAALAGAASAAADDEAKAKAACDRAETLAKPKAGSAGASAKDCDALALYDGDAGKPDFSAARACALNAAGDPDIAFPPEAVLSMIFANGDGVSRNDDLAIAYACAAGGAPAETTGRVLSLLERKSKGAGVTERFDFCDDITSGMMQGFCASRSAGKTAVGRNEELAKLTGALQPQAKAAYAKLRKAFEAYRDAVGENEVDVSGTARGAMIVEAEEAEETAFLETLKQVLGGAPASGPALAEADKALNAAYKKVQAEKDESRWGTVTKAGVKTSQRAWLPYRDAFAAFATAAGSKTSAEQLTATLTAKRAEDLQSFVEN